MKKSIISQQFWQEEIRSKKFLQKEVGENMKRKSLLNIITIGLLVLMLSIIAGCGPEKKAMTTGDEAYAVITDDLGRVVKLTKKPERIVVLSASFLEPLHAVDASIVGRPSSKTDVPDFAKDLPEVGAVYQIDVEKVLALQPDLVIANKGMNEKFVALMESNNIPIIVMDMKSYANVKNEVNVFAQITGEKEKGAVIVSGMDEKIKAVQAKLPKDKKRVAILHSTAQGLSVQLDGSIAGSVAKMLGFENVAADQIPMEKNPDATPYSLETLVQQDPDLIFVTSMGKLEAIKKSMMDNVAGNPAWQSIPAIKNNQMYFLPQNLFLLSPGLHYPEAVEMMAKLVYPGVFK